MRIIFWGTGNTAKGKIGFIKKLSDNFEIVGFIDGCEDNITNSFWNGYRLIAPKCIYQYDADYLCILSISEWEIRKRIYKEKLFDVTRILDLHEIYMMNFCGAKLDVSYEQFIPAMHSNQLIFAKEWRIFEYLKRKYSYVLCADKYRNIKIHKKVYIKKEIRPIWVLWIQGFEEAPELIKVCVHSIKRILGKNEQIFLLDKDNLFDFIDLPEYILHKWERGIISNTHFSDLVRLRLLNIYGGVWIDATVYFTGNSLPDFIRNSKLFMYNLWMDWKACPEPKISASWLISANSGNRLLMILEALLDEYWKREEKMIDYFLFHIFFTMEVECYPEEWENVEKVLRDPAQLLNEELNCKFNIDRFNRLIKMSDIHKLSYKKQYNKGGQNSFWAKICEMEKVSMSEKTHMEEM